jgi:hypothetical protein
MIRSALMNGLGWASDTLMDGMGARADAHDEEAGGEATSRETRKNLRRLAGRMVLGAMGAYWQGAQGMAKDQLKERMGHTAHRRYPVLTRRPLLAKVKEARSEGKSLQVYLGCGTFGQEVIAASRDPRNKNSLLVGVEHHGFRFTPSKEELSGAVFHDGHWQHVLRDLAESGGVDEIIGVAPSSPWQDLERRMKKGDAMAVLFAEDVTVLNDQSDDFQILYDALKLGGRVILYTEDATWSRDFADSLVRVFGVGVEITEIPSAEAPPSRILQKFPVTYRVTAVRRK